MRRLTDADRRALVAARQLLGPAGRADRSVVDVAHAVGPLHSTDPSTAYLQIAARSDASIHDIDRALYDDRLLLRHTTLRRTVHLLTVDLAVAAHGAYNHRLVPGLRRNLVAWIAASDDVDVDAAPWLATLEDAVADAVAALERPSGAELAEAVPDLQTRFEVAPGKSYSRPQRITSKVLELLIADGRIARDRPRGGDLTSGAWTYAPVTDWIPGGLPAGDPAACLVDLLDHRLRAYPGCSVADLAWWTGLPKGQVRTALAALATTEVARDDGETGYVHADDTLDGADHRAPGAALLPGLDATPMGCTQRDWMLDDAMTKLLFDRSGNIGPTVWWDGRIVGGWTQRDDGTIVTEIEADIGAAGDAAVTAESDRLAAWLGGVRVRWRYPTPLQRQLQGG